MQPRRARDLFPKSGRAYELFDTAILLFIIGLFGYVLTDPPETEALAPLRLITATQLGVFVAGASLVAVVCSYVRPLLALGYVIAIFGSTLMCANYFIGSLLLGFTSEDGLRAFMSAIVFGWITRRFFRNAVVHDPVDVERYVNCGNQTRV